MKFLSVIVFILGPVIMSLAQPLPDDPSGNGLPGTGAPTVSCPIGNGYWILFSVGIQLWCLQNLANA